MLGMGWRFMICTLRKSLRKMASSANLLASGLVRAELLIVNSKSETEAFSGIFHDQNNAHDQVASTEMALRLISFFLIYVAFVHSTL